MSQILKRMRNLGLKQVDLILESTQGTDIPATPLLRSVASTAGVERPTM